MQNGRILQFPQNSSWTNACLANNLLNKTGDKRRKESTWHVDTINLRFYSHIRFYTTISYIQPPLRDPEAFSRLPAKKVRAWRKQGIKKGVAVLWRNFLCAFKTPRATKGGDGVRIFPELLFERQKFHSRLNLVIGWRTSI